MDTGFYPGLGPLDGGKTLHPAFDYIDMDVVQSTCIYHEIVVMNMRCLLTSLASVYIRHRRPRVLGESLPWAPSLVESSLYAAGAVRTGP